MVPLYKTYAPQPYYESDGGRDELVMALVQKSAEGGKNTSWLTDKVGCSADKHVLLFLGCLPPHFCRPYKSKYDKHARLKLQHKLSHKKHQRALRRHCSRLVVCYDLMLGA